MSPYHQSAALTQQVGNDSTMKRILVVEDEPDLRRALSLRLTSAGYEVVTAPDGRAATATALRVWPDLILLDLGLPGVNGHAVASQLRIDGRPQFPIIVLTARGEIDDRILAAESGVVAYLVKPYEPDTLLMAVRSVLGDTSPPAPEPSVRPALGLVPRRND